MIHVGPSCSDIDPDKVNQGYPEGPSIGLRYGLFGTQALEEQARAAPRFRYRPPRGTRLSAWPTTNTAPAHLLQWKGPAAGVTCRKNHHPSVAYGIVGGVFAGSIRLAMVAAFGVGLAAVAISAIPALVSGPGDAARLTVLAIGLALALAVYQTIFRRRW